MAYGLPLSGEDGKCLSLLNAVEETISRQLRACKAPSSGRKVLEGFSSLPSQIFCNAKALPSSIMFIFYAWKFKSSNR